MNEVTNPGGIFDKTGDGEGDPLESMKQFRAPAGSGTPKIVPEAEPVNMNPDIKTGNPSAAMFGMGRGEYGSNC